MQKSRIGFRKKYIIQLPDIDIYQCLRNYSFERKNLSLIRSLDQWFSTFKADGPVEAN